MPIDPVTGSLITTALNLGGGIFSQASARGAYQHRYQDTVADMRKAGLNPALAYGQSPGGGAQTHNFGDVGTGASSAYQTVTAARQAKANAELTEAQASLLKAQRADLLRRTMSEADLAFWNAETGEHSAKSAAVRASRDRETLPADISAAKTLAELQRLNLPEARAMAKYYQQTGSASPYLNSAAQLLRMLIEGRTTLRGRIIPRGGRVE